MKIIALVVGALGALLGGLWLLQGLGLIHLAPIACVAECTPLEGPSLQWAAIGAIVLVVSLSAILYGLRRAR